MSFTEIWKMKGSRTFMIKEALFICLLSIALCIYIIWENNREIQKLNEDIKQLEVKFSSVFGAIEQ